MENKKRVALIVQLDPEMKKFVKIQAAKRGESMREYIENILREEQAALSAPLS